MSTLELKLNTLKKIPDLYEFTLENCFIAGGAARDTIRSTPPKDYDMFFLSDSAKDEFIRKFGNHCTVTGFGNYNWDEFQFITLVTGSPESVTDTFDWNVNQVWFNLKAKRFGGHLSTSNYLMFNCKSRTPLSAIMRLPMLIKKGYVIEPKELLFAYTFVALSVNMANPEAVNLQQAAAISNNAGPCTGVESVTKRAVKAVLENSPLCQVLK